MKIVVTGALGYLGSALIQKLIPAFPHSKLIFIDNLSTGKLQALKGLRPRRAFQLIKADVRSFDFSKLSLTPEDIVIHLAALSRPSESYERPQEFKSVNFTGAVRVAKACARTSARLFFPSTTSVYHELSGKTISRVTSHLKPQTPYAAAKLKAERTLIKIKGLRYTAIRFGTIFGKAPVHSLQTAVNKFCWQASEGEPLTVWKTALKQIRPYLAIEDAVDLILFLVRKDYFDRKTYHAATCHASVQDVVTIIRKIKPSLQVNLKKAKAMNALSYRINLHGLLNLGFCFRGNLKKSIRQMLEARR